MNHKREIGFKLAMAAVFLAAWGALVQGRGGLAATAVPAYAESIEHAVAPEITARVATVNVKLGDEVKAGQVLATLDDRALRLERDRANAELEQLNAELSAQDLISKDEVLWYSMRNSNVLADESAARSDAESLKIELARLDRLRAERLIDATAEATVRREYQAAAARVRVFESRRAKMPEIYGPHGRPQVAAETEARVRPYREAIKAKKAALAELDFRLAQHQLRAPVDGTVSLLTHPVGDVVPAGGEVLKLVRGRAGYVMATVPEERARSLHTGLTLTVRSSRGLWSTPLRGTVVELGPSVEQLPERSWLAPQYPRWGRRAIIQVEGALKWKAGERLYVHFE